jgi:hypothetical protein
MTLDFMASRDLSRISKILNIEKAIKFLLS